MEKQKITQINRFTTNKDGSLLTFTKDGKQIPYTRILLKTDRHGDKTMSGFGNKFNQDWKVGDEIEINVTEVVKDGKTYYNFETPKADDKVNAKLEEVLTKLGKIDFTLSEVVRFLKQNVTQRTSDGSPMPNFDVKDIEYPTDEISVEDIPL